MNDVVNHPGHYNQGKIECIDYILDKEMNFCRGNAVKYITRAGLKDSDKEIEDLEKAIFYLNQEIERLKDKDLKEAVADVNASLRYSKIDVERLEQSTKETGINKCKSKEEEEKIVTAFMNCIDIPKCKDCPWEDCEEIWNEKVTIPRTLAGALKKLLEKKTDWKSETE